MFWRTKFLIVYTVFPSEEAAAHVASEVISKKLTACANIFPKGRSLYWWEGVVHDNPECVMVLKTQKKHWKALEQEIRTMHPYDVPAIVALPIACGSAPYLQWLEEETKV